MVREWLLAVLQQATICTSLAVTNCKLPEFSARCCHCLLSEFVKHHISERGGIALAIVLWRHEICWVNNASSYCTTCVWNIQWNCPLRHAQDEQLGDGIQTQKYLDSDSEIWRRRGSSTTFRPLKFISEFLNSSYPLWPIYCPHSVCTQSTPPA